MKPESHELLAILILQLSPEPPANIELPRDEQQLAKGLLAAVEKAPSVDLGRFVDMATGQLSSEAQTSLQKLQAGDKPKLVTEGNSYIMPPNMADTVKSSIRIFFSGPQIEELKQAADAAGRVWFPQ